MVLATRIAESSVAMTDVVHVVDCCVHREVSYDPTENVQNVNYNYVSKASIVQRRFVSCI